MNPEAQKILTMIEGLTPQILEAIEGRGYDDVDKFTVINEINGRVHCLINKVEYLSCGELRSYGFEQRVMFKDSSSEEVQNELCEDYADSIDAQEALRRDEPWILEVQGVGDDWFANLARGVVSTTEFGLSTEPLARLHAWVQVLGMEK